jgi:hypothetical protein
VRARERVRVARAARVARDKDGKGKGGVARVTRAVRAARAARARGPGQGWTRDEDTTKDKSIILSVLFCSCYC